MLENFRLKVFRSVAEQKSFRKASELLNITQPAVSQQIHALEEELGVPLFDRSGSRVSPTAAGTVLLRYAQRAAAIAAEAETELASMQGKVAGELRLGGMENRGEDVFLRNRGAVLRVHPPATVSWCTGITEWGRGGAVVVRVLGGTD